MSKKETPLFAFFGTPHFSVVVLEALQAQGYLPTLVITAPDRPQGRGQKLTPSPVKAWAEKNGIDVVTPEKLSDENFIAELGNTQWDVFVTAAYGKILPKSILDLPRRGCLNVHPSLLPKFRGASPVLSAILHNERATGVTIMLMDEKMDHGPIVAQARIELEEDAWPPQGSFFEDMLATEGGNLLAETLMPWIEGEIAPEVQDEAQATFTKKFTDADALVDLQGDAAQNLLKIRAFDKNPRAYFLDSNGKRVIITQAHIEDGKLVVDKVIPEGKKEVEYKDFRKV
jgi:methionyl-tRNA formyltransferase